MTREFSILYNREFGPFKGTAKYNAFIAAIVLCFSKQKFLS
jgi:hypothetical protein